MFHFDIGQYLRNSPQPASVTLVPFRNSFSSLEFCPLLSKIFLQSLIASSSSISELSAAESFSSR